MARAVEAARWAALAVVLIGAAVHAMTPFNAMPGWDLDPTMFPFVMSGVGPLGCRVIDLAIILGAAGLLAMEARPLGRGVVVLLGLISAGAAGVLLHGFVLGGAELGRPALGDLRIGGAWIAALTAAAALASAGRDRAVRAVCLSAVLGFAAVLAAKGVHQVFVEHPRTLADFAANREQFLAAHGWTADSPMARSYERRLSHSDATGWFALSNVYASFGAAGLVGFLGLLWTSWPWRAASSAHSPGGEGGGGASPTTISLLVLGVGTSAAVLLLGQSKGGIVATGAGLGALVALRLAQRTSRGDRLGGLIGAAAVVLPLALVALRGAVGERIGELSLLFRWFYMQGAARMFLGSPLFGVGPDDFQAAYQTSKPPLSTEDVMSPHSVLIDYVSMLGVAGMCMAAAVAMLAVRAGRAGASMEGAGRVLSHGDRGESTGRQGVLCLGAVAALSVLIAFRLTPDLLPIPRSVAAGEAVGLLVAMLVGLMGLAAGWTLLGVGVLRAARDGRGINAAAAGAALTLVAHAQIEVTATWQASAALWGIMLGVGAAGFRDPTGEEAAAGVRRSRRMAGRLALCVLPLLCGSAGVVTTARVERQLLSAAETVAPLAELSRLRAETAAGSADERRFALLRLAEALSALTGRPVRPDGQELAATGMSVEVLLLGRGAAQLADASKGGADLWRVRREASRLWLRQAELIAAMGNTAEVETPLARALGAMEGHPGESVLAGVQGMVATVHETRARLLNDAEARGRAVSALAAAAKADPYSVVVRLRLLRAAQAAGDKVLAAETARELLRLDGLKRLDAEGAGLSAAARTEVEAAAGAP